MDKVLKQRIIGAFVLVISTVVLWPLIFDEPDERFVAEQIQAPEPPEFETFEVDEPIRPEGIQNIQSPQEPEIQITEMDDNKLPASAVVKTEAVKAQAINTEPSKAVTVKKEETKKIVAPTKAEDKSIAQRVEPLKSMNITTELTEQGLPKSWAVQVGVFSSRDNANRFREQLIKDYYRSDIKIVNNGDKDFAKVFVGPVINQNQAQKLKVELDKKYHIQSLVFLYAP